MNHVTGLGSHDTTFLSHSRLWVRKKNKNPRLLSHNGDS